MMNRRDSVLSNCLLCAALLLPSFVYAEQGVEVWARRYDGGVTNNDQAVSVAVDHENNVVVTGNSASSNNLPGYATLKYSPMGVPLWTNRLQAPSPLVSGIPSLGIDGSNNVFVGTATGVAKYSSGGELLWTNRFVGNGYSRALALDGDGNVILAGNYQTPSATVTTRKYATDGVIIWSNTAVASASPINTYCLAVDANNSVIVAADVGNYTTIKMSAAGASLWTNRFSEYNSKLNALAVDRHNNVIVSGTSYFPFNPLFFVTVKYDESGIPLWTNRSCPGGSAALSGIAVDSDDNVVLTGVAGSSHPFAMTLKIDSNGASLWTNYLAEVDSNASIKPAVTIDSSNNVIVAAYSVSPQYFTNFAVAKYTPGGVPLWTNVYAGVGERKNLATAVCVDSRRDILVAGVSKGTNTADDFAVLKYVSVPQPQLSFPSFHDGMTELRVDQVMIGGTLFLETSSNCLQWTQVLTNYGTTNSILFSEPADISVPRFYRAMQRP